MRKSVCALELFAMRHGALLTFFVDELGLVFRVDVSLAVCRLPCEVAVARRCGAPVVSGRVPPVITLLVWWRAGRAARTLLQSPSQDPSRRSSDDSLGRREPRFGRLGFK